MSYREMAIDAGARGEEEIRRMAAMIEEEHQRSQYDQHSGPDSLRELFDRLRHDPAHHLGMGDIRLTMGQQDEIADAWEADLDAQRYSARERVRLQEENAALRERRDRIEGLKWENAALRDECQVLRQRVEAWKLAANSDDWSLVCAQPEVTP